MRVSDLEFTVALMLSNSVAPFAGLLVRASRDPLRSTGGYVAYEAEGRPAHGYIHTRLAADVSGRRWGMGLLYDVDPSADATLPSPGESLDGRFRQRAEVEFGYASVDGP